MHTKSYNGLEIRFSGPDLYQDEIDSAMTYLHNQIEEIDRFSDKSLFSKILKSMRGGWHWLGLLKK